MIRGRRVAITGICGYIGSAVARRLLQAGVGSVAGLQHQTPLPADLDGSIEVVQGDLGRADTVRELVRGADFVVHCAARLGSESQRESLRVNVDAVETLAHVALGCGVRRVVHLSTIEVYGDFAGRCLTEASATEPVGHPYVDSKQLGERTMRDTLAGTRTDLVILRPGMVYGPGSEFWSVRLHDAAREGRFELIDGGRGAIFPVFIDDLVDACVAGLWTRGVLAGSAFNIVGGEAHVWRDLAQAYATLLGVRQCWTDVPAALWRLRWHERHGHRTAFRSRRYEVLARYGTIPVLAARRHLSWTPATTLAEGMRITGEWLGGADARSPAGQRKQPAIDPEATTALDVPTVQPTDQEQGTPQ